MALRPTMHTAEPTAPSSGGDLAGPPIARHVTRPDLARWFVWGVLIAMLLAVLACIARWGRNIPLAEEWTLVAPLTGHEASLPGWLWAQNNEHRLPLSKLLLLVLLKLTGGDFRTGMVANVAVLAGLSAAMIRTAAHMRGGRQRWADAFFPVLFLHIGNWENLVWGWQLQFTVSVALTCVLLLAVVRDPELVGGRTAAAAALAFVLLPLCGANGLIFSAAMAPWAAYVALRHRSTAAGRALGAAVAVSLLLVALYFVGYERPPWVPPNPGKLATLQTAAIFAAMASGPWVLDWWNPSILATAAFLAPTLLVLVVGALGEWRAPRRERERALGIVCFVGGTAVLTLAMGYGRAGYVPEIGMPTRYVLLAAPSLCAAFFVWELYSTPAFRRAVPAALCVVMVALIPLNTRKGFSWRDWYVGGMAAVERDIAAGLPRTELAKRHYKFLLHWNEQLCADAIGWLRATGRGPFAAVRD